MINLSALKHAIPIISKSTLLITDLIQINHQQELIDQFPQLTFFEMKREELQTSFDRKHSFKFMTTQAIDATNFSKAMSTSIWHRFIEAITDMEYINHLSKLIDTDLSSARWSFELAQYRGGDWKGAHYDQQKDKIVTQLFYFNSYWDVTWGGHLHILHPDDHAVSVLTIPPTINYSVITMTKPDAWHKVGKMQPHAKLPRLVMGLQFYR